MTPTRVLAGVALVLGLAAALAGSPYAAGRGRIDVDSLGKAAAAGQDRVSAIELATWIRERKPGLRVVDVRSHADFAEYAIPGAENIPLDAVGSAAFAPGETVVLYAEDGARAAQAWVFLRALGHGRVFFVENGLADWRDRVISPVLAAGASPAAAKEFEKVAELSRYFGGEPSLGSLATSTQPPAPVATEASSDLARMRKRGC